MLGTAAVALIVVWTFFAVFPFAWMILTSVHSEVDAFADPPRLLAPWTLFNFVQVWIHDRFWTHALSTVIVTVTTVTISLSIGLLAGYALSRFRGPLGFWILLVALIFRAMPPIVLLTAVKPAFYADGLWNHYYALALVMVALNQPVTIYMLRSFFLNVPVEIDEAALGAYLNAAHDMSQQMYAIAGAVSITVPLIVIVLVFQRQIVSGLVQGAVKG